MKEWVKGIQTYLNSEMSLNPALVEDGKIGPKTMAALAQYLGINNSDTDESAA